MTLKSLVQNAQRGTLAAYVRPFHRQWLELPEKDRIFSPMAVDHVAKVMRGGYKKPRAGRFSPSGLGYCKRRQLFGYLDAPQAGENPDSLELMEMGTRDHVWWQAEGMSFPFDEPYMPKAEVFVHDPTIRLGGSIDGILRDGSGFELKTSMWTVYKQVLDADEPKMAARMQRETYRMLTGIDVWSIIYQERGTGSSYEFRHEGEDKEAWHAAEQVLEDLNDHVDAGTLEPQLPECARQQGTVFKQCPFREMCHKVHDIADTVQLVQEAA